MPSEPLRDALALAEAALAKRAHAIEYEKDELHEISVLPGGRSADETQRSYEKSLDVSSHTYEENELGRTPTELFVPSPAVAVRINPGMLMTLGHVHGYPRLPLSPGVSIAEGYASWRKFTRYADVEKLALAAAAACRTWRSDPMTNDLTYIELDETADPSDENPLTGCCTEAHPRADHFDDVFDAYRNGQEERYLEPGLGGAA